MFACHYIAHVRISLDIDLELHVVFVCMKEGMFPAQCSMRLKKVAEGLVPSKTYAMLVSYPAHFLKMAAAIWQMIWETVPTFLAQ